MSTPLLELRNVSVHLGGVTVLDRVTMSLDAGESVALVGPNGSGKSTLFRAVLGLAPCEGTVLIGGHDLRRDPVAARSLLAWVPQRPAFGDATAQEWMAFLASVRRVERPKERIAACLERTGLIAHARSKARLFSGGMQQRLAIAGALLADAPLLLLDEPTASLDREGRRDFVELVLGLRQQKRTLLLASHRPEEVERLASRTVQLEAGRIVEAASDTVPREGVVIPLFPAGEAR